VYFVAGIINVGSEAGKTFLLMCSSNQQFFQIRQTNVVMVGASASHLYLLMVGWVSNVSTLEQEKHMICSVRSSSQLDPRLS